MNSCLKLLITFFAAAIVLPFVAIYRLGASLLGPKKAFPGWSQTFSLLPGLTGNYLRRAFYWWVFPECGDGACICFGTVFSHATARVGCNVYIGPFCSLGDVTLEEDVLLGSHVSITNGSNQHGIDRLDIPIREQPGTWPRITIGRDSWIGDRSIIMANVGKHCVIGAGSVVTKPIPDYAIAAGVPARVLRFRDRSETPVPDRLSTVGSAQWQPSSLGDAANVAVHFEENS